MSLVKANNSQDPNMRLSEYEMISQIRSALSLSLGPCPFLIQFSAHFSWQVTKRRQIP